MPEITNDTQKVYTVGEWLFGCVNFSVSQETVDSICAKREVLPSTLYSDMEGGENKNPTLRLMKADLYKWIVLGPGKINNTSDGDNGWSHSGGGYTLSKDDKKLMIGEANGIYEELEPESVFGKCKIRMRSAGIMPAYRDFDGNPIPRDIH